MSLCLRIADICLYTLWGVLSIAGFSVQLYRERNRPQFPEHKRRRTEPRAAELPTHRRRTGHHAERQPLVSGATAGYRSERQPLVSGYGSVGMEDPSSETPQHASDPATAAMLPPPPPYS